MIVQSTLHSSETYYTIIMTSCENKLNYHQNEDVVELGSAGDLVVGPVK